MQKNAASLAKSLSPAGWSSDATEGYIEDMAGCFLLVLQIVYDRSLFVFYRQDYEGASERFLDGLKLDPVDTDIEDALR